MNKEIKNFVDNIHNDTYKNAYQSPRIQASDWIVKGERMEESLDGLWNFSIDMYDNCLRAKWYLEQGVNEEGQRVPLDYGFDDWETVSVPGVWNLAKPEYYYYEGSAVYSRRFFYEKQDEDRVFLRFGAVYYEARIFLNGVFMGLHQGGSTPFCVEVTSALKSENRLIVVVDNTRKKEQIPSDNTDWFLYGGIYREVSLVRLPNIYIKDFKVWLSDRIKKEITVEVELSEQTDGFAVLELPGLQIKKEIPVQAGRGTITVQADHLELWSPEAPKLYDVLISWQKDVVKDRVGFRTIETVGNQIVLNGQPIYLRGVCVHEETQEHGKAIDEKDIQTIFAKAKEMGCNFLRLAHYPHTEKVSKLADEVGLLLWEEIPVYWWIDFENPATLEDGKNQLRELIQRDQNRASVILWSVGNENPDTDARYEFMASLAILAKNMDSTRLVTAACLVDTVNLQIADRLEQHLDLIGVNEYYGWYDPDYGKLVTILEHSHPKKPVLISEFGADGAACVFEEEEVRGSEIEQKIIYQNQIAMFQKTKYIQGIIPWILFDYRTPKRLGKYQKGYNIKGLITADRKHKKLAFQEMKEFYDKKALEYGDGGLEL